MSEDLVYRLRKRAEIRRQIDTRKSVQEGKPDRIADLLEEAAKRIDDLEMALANHPPMKCYPGAHGPAPSEPCDVCAWAKHVRSLFDSEQPRESDVTLLSLIGQWAHQYGAALVPTAGSSDSFGDGMREAKRQIQVILSRKGS
jgi:hypothetical protein